MSELALKLIAENYKTHATFLDLGNCGLTKVPDEIGDLVWLEELSFSSERRDGEDILGSQNSGDRNNITELNSTVHRLKQSTSGLGQLTKLKKLWLSSFDYGSKNINLSDLSILANFGSLQQLYVSCTKVTDLSPLANLGELQLLDVSGTPVTDLSPLANLDGLQQLYAFFTPVTDLSPLANLVGLQHFSASDTQVTDLIPLTNLAELQWLDISDTQVTDLTPLANLAELQELNISNTQVTDLSPLLRFI